MLNDDCYRTGICESPMCSCEVENETVEHVLLRCSKYAEVRSVMMNTLHDNSKNSRKWNLAMPENVLLTPYIVDNGISRSDDSCVK